VNIGFHHCLAGDELGIELGRSTHGGMMVEFSKQQMLLRESNVSVLKN